MGGRLRQGQGGLTSTCPSGTKHALSVGLGLAIPLIVAIGLKPFAFVVTQRGITLGLNMYSSYGHVGGNVGGNAGDNHSTSGRGSRMVMTWFGGGSTLQGVIEDIAGQG